MIIIVIRENPSGHGFGLLPEPHRGKEVCESSSTRDVSTPLISAGLQTGRLSCKNFTTLAWKADANDLRVCFHIGDILPEALKSRHDS